MSRIRGDKNCSQLKHEADAVNSPYVVWFTEDKSCPREASGADVGEGGLTDGTTQASGVPVGVYCIEKVAVKNVGAAAGALFDSC